MATPTPTTINSSTRNARERAMSERLLSQKMSGVNAAQTHASTKAMAIGAAGDIRKPKPRGSSRRFTDESVAREVQKRKISAISRGLNWKGEFLGFLGSSGFLGVDAREFLGFLGSSEFLGVDARPSPRNSEEPEEPRGTEEPEEPEEPAVRWPSIGPP